MATVVVAGHHAAQVAWSRAGVEGLGSGRSLSRLAATGHSLGHRSRQAGQSYAIVVMLPAQGHQVAESLILLAGALAFFAARAYGGLAVALAEDRTT